MVDLGEEAKDNDDGGCEEEEKDENVDMNRGSRRAKGAVFGGKEG